MQHSGDTVFILVRHRGETQAGIRKIGQGYYVVRLLRLLVESKATTKKRVVCFVEYSTGASSRLPSVSGAAVSLRPLTSLWSCSVAWRVRYVVRCDGRFWIRGVNSVDDRRGDGVVTKEKSGLEDFREHEHEVASELLLRE
jgi:hypothetical protein